jgi:pimeloyl-ACP methyl ester carboxylesterase
MTKVLQILATIGFLLGGIALLCAPAPAQSQAQSQSQSGAKAAFTPTRFTVVDAGTPGKPDVLLIPGLASSRTVWDGEAKLLDPNYRLHLVQVNGFAGQPAGANATGTMLPGIVDELHAYLVAAKMKPIVIGHSLGGLLTLMLADKHPEEVRKMVIVDTLPFYALLFNASATADSVKPQVEAMKQQLVAIPADQYAMMQSMMAPTLVKDPQGQKLVAASGVASDRAVVAAAMAEDMETDMRGALAEIKTPALVLYEYDPSMPMPDAGAYEKTMKASYKSMPNVTLVRMDGSRHFIMYDQPEKFDAALEAFLK